MPEIGQTVSHYRILEKIGKGGMGEVYQATDTKLGRDVAIKVLPEEFAKDNDRVARFQHKSLNQGLATFMPGAAQAVNRFPLNLSWRRVGHQF